MKKTVIFLSLFLLHISGSHEEKNMLYCYTWKKSAL